MINTCTTLQPCPFCEGEWVETIRPANGAQPHIGCKGCNARGPFTAGMTEEQWRSAWNQRAVSAVPDVRPKVHSIGAVEETTEFHAKKDLEYIEGLQAHCDEGGKVTSKNVSDLMAMVRWNAEELLAALTKPSVPDVGEAVTEAETWLRECSAWLLSTDLDMTCPMETDPLDIADKLAALTQSLPEEPSHD